MIALGIETSCDETAAAVVETTGEPSVPWRVRSNIIASQTRTHEPFGGVVPELASRQHIRDICGVVTQALERAGVAWPDVGAIAVTQGPGLVGSLLVGVSFAKAAGTARHIPVMPVHHLAGHIESLVLEHGEIPLPAAVLVVSGGHTSLYLVPEPGQYRLMGRTRDDAAGEAYDKVARLLGLGYPGGPVIDRLAQGGRDDAVPLPRPKFTHPDRNRLPDELIRSTVDLTRGVAEFSFSGLKTAVLRRLDDAGGVDALSPQVVADFCASFQRVVVESLIDQTLLAAQVLGARCVGVAGGVSANSRLRREAVARGQREGLPVFVPPLSLATDNAAMIAAAGLRKFSRGVPATLEFSACATIPIF